MRFIQSIDSISCKPLRYLAVGATLAGTLLLFSILLTYLYFRIDMQTLGVLVFNIVSLGLGGILGLILSMFNYVSCTRTKEEEETNKTQTKHTKN